MAKVMDYSLEAFLRFLSAEYSWEEPLILRDISQRVPLPFFYRDGFMYVCMYVCM